jgi:hypothetical protein
MSAFGQNLPRNLAGGAVALPLKAAAPVARRRGSCGRKTEIAVSGSYLSDGALAARANAAAPEVAVTAKLRAMVRLTNARKMNVFVQ